MDRALLQRVWTFARPYRTRLALFLAAITGASLMALVPPLLFRRIIDDAIPAGDRGLVTVLGLATVGVALFSTALDLGQRWWSSAIGEGADLRSALLAVRPRAAHARGVLHPYPDRVADQPQ